MYLAVPPGPGKQCRNCAYPLSQRLHEWSQSIYTAAQLSHRLTCDKRCLGK